MIYLSAVIVGLVCLIIARRYLPTRWAVLVIAVKLGLVCVYHDQFYNEEWNFIDDLTYLNAGSGMLEEGHNPFEILTIPEELFRLDYWGGYEILYSWWNMLACYILGNHYYSPVLFNVVLTFILGIVVDGFMKDCGLVRVYRRAAVTFFLLHWELLAYSTVLNLKDILSLTLVSSGLLIAKRLRSSVTLRRALALATILALLVTIRFYGILLILGTATLWFLVNLMQGKHLVRTIVAIFALAGVIVTVLVLVEPVQVVLVDQLRGLSVETSPAQIAYQAVWFLLSPRPWGLGPDRTFLFWPAILHWLFFIPTIVGGFWLRKHKEFKYILIYSTIVLMVNSCFPQDIRHRLQINIILVWSQFHFLWEIVCKSKEYRKNYLAQEFLFRSMKQNKLVGPFSS